MLLNIKEIQIDPKLQTREVSAEYVRHLGEQLELGEHLPPLTVTKTGGTFYLIGGFNRLEAYRRAMPDGGEVETKEIECPDFSAMMEAAILDNRGHGKMYTEREKEALYYRLTRELKWTHKRATQALGITEGHAERWDETKMIHFPASTERAIRKEKPTVLERAERAEKTAGCERAVTLEEPKQPERVTPDEQPIRRERAEPPESEEIASIYMGQISFHASQLLKLLQAQHGKKIPASYSLDFSVLIKIIEEAMKK